MIPMFAEVFKNGEWHKVRHVFPSALPELDGQLTDRVYDGSNKALEAVLSGKVNIEVLNIHDGMPDDASAEITEHVSLVGRKVRYVYANDLLSSLVKYYIYKIGYITEWQYKRLVKDGIKPVNIRHNIPKSTGVKVTPMEMDMILNNPVLRREDIKYFVEYKYDGHDFIKDCPFFFSNTALKLAYMLEQYEKVRIIYGMKE